MGASPSAKVELSRQELREQEIKGDKKPGQGRRPSVASVAPVIAPVVALGSTVVLIFGGCCSNVYALEAVVKFESSVGPLLTLAQFAFVAITGYVSQFDATRPPLFLAPRHIPLPRLMVNVILFYCINMLNNYAFSYDISVPIHIILRSGGSVTTLIAGSIWGKKYTGMQFFCVALLTVGVVGAALADAARRGKVEIDDGLMGRDFGVGVAMLILAQILSAIQGIYTEETYKTYGPHWKENLFYSHTLSLPFFFPLLPSLQSQYSRLASSPPLSFPFAAIMGLQSWPAPLDDLLGTVHVPEQLVYVVANVGFQYLCISGVNHLAAVCSALAVTIVLNVRKLVSLMLSIWLFGNTLAPGTLVGAGVAFFASGLYTLSPGRKRR